MSDRTIGVWRAGAFAEVEEKRQGERDANRENGDERQPAPRDASARILEAYEEQKRDGGDQDVHAEKRADAVGEELLKEKREIQTVGGHPG